LRASRNHGGPQGLRLSDLLNVAWKWNRLPFPGSLSAHIAPPMSFARRRHMVSPGPCRRSFSSLTCPPVEWFRNLSQHLRGNSDASVSLHSMEYYVSSDSFSLRSASSISPDEVNFAGITNQLRSTCRNREGSPFHESRDIIADAARGFLYGFAFYPRSHKVHTNHRT